MIDVKVKQFHLLRYLSRRSRLRVYGCLPMHQEQFVFSVQVGTEMQYLMKNT